TKGEENIGTFSKSPMSVRKWCKICGGHVFSDHPPMGLVDVYAALIPSLQFQPAVHVNYGEKVLSVRDGLPKMKDFPAEMGGSGISLPD
ncbi:MAG: GFA family protein, partial [Pseudomonadota bacterium]|nr:GFA family protein [Pseudomonadota bacterium]